MFKHIIESLSIEAKKENLDLKDILFRLFDNQELKDKYLNEIRRSTIIWQVANDVLNNIWAKDKCKIMAIWDVKYFWDIKSEWEKLTKNSLSEINVNNISWYDLSWQGSQELRDTLFDYMNQYYDLSKLNRWNVSNSIIPTYWWTDWFVFIIDTIKVMYPSKDIKFIYPESSFMANVKIAESALWKENLIQVNKPNTSNFFFSWEQIKEIYSKYKGGGINIYYITPVGNPTWSKIEEKDFIRIIKKINSLDSEAIFILDSVYVGILEENQSINMFTKLLNDKKLLNQVIFSESLSKTLGTTWLRLGWIWSTNLQYSWELKKNIILKKAWFSKILNEFIINFLKNKEDIITFQNKVYSYWSSQRMKFIEMVKLQYAHLFDFESSCKVIPREWIYILLKVKDGFRAEEIFAETWIIWVWITLSDGLYIRYAFWNVNYF